LIGWFRETYYDEGKEPFFAKEDLEKIGDLILLMLKYRPEDRPTASDLLEHPLIQQLSFPPRGEDEMLGVGQRQIVLQKPNEQDSDQASPLRGRHMYLP
jgi:serine/threonine protein kinase